MTAQPQGDTPVEREPRLRYLIPLIVASGFFLEQLDSTIITTAIPDMAKALDESTLRLNLALTSYLVTLAVFIPISGWIADRFGMKRTFCAAIIVFSLGSMLCGMSNSLGFLVFSRVLQGCGGAMMNPVGRLVLLRSFPRKDLVTAMTYVSIPSILGPVIGPLAGGLITTYANWRWIFYVNVPFGILGVFLAWNFIRDLEMPQPGRFDTLGFLITALGMAGFEVGIENLGHPVLPVWLIVGVFAIAIGLAALYVPYSRRHSNAVLDLTMMRVRSFRIGSTAGGLCRMGLNAVPFLLPLMLQVAFGYTPVQSGSTTFVASFGAVILRPVSVRLLRWLGFDRLMLVGAIFGATMTASFALIGPSTPYPLLLLTIFVFGTARNVAFNTVQTLTYSEIPSGVLSRATSLGSVMQQLAMGFGISLSATVLGMIAGSGTDLSVRDFHLVFLILAVVPLLAVPELLHLRPEDGMVVSGHRRRVAPHAAED